MLHVSHQAFHRRMFLAAGGLSLMRFGLSAPCSVLAAEAAEHEQGLQVRDIQRVTVRVPYRPVPRRAMDRELPHWRYAEVFQVRLRSGMIGFGETLLYYTWGVSEDDDVARVIGRNAAAVMWDDTLGAGLQMALFDAVGKSLDVPVHRLLGSQVHETTPVSWWNIDMPAEDMAAECREAHRSGYTAYKTKGRPWFDVWKQVATVAQAVPESFQVDLDFKDTLFDADRAIPIHTENPRQCGRWVATMVQGAQQRPQNGLRPVAVRMPRTGSLQVNTLTGFFLTLVVLPLRTRLSMQLEILALRHQLAVYQQSGVRPRIKPVDRLLWAWLSKVWSDWRNATNRHRVAAKTLPRALGAHKRADEVRPALNCPGGETAHPQDVPGQSVLGIASYSRGTAEAGD